jgi:hypothetical protein
MLPRAVTIAVLLLTPLILPLWAGDEAFLTRATDRALAPDGSPLSPAEPSLRSGEFGLNFVPARDAGRKPAAYPAKGMLTPAAAPVNGVTIAVDTQTTHQTMDGFGGEFIGYLSPPLGLTATQIGQVLTLALGQVQLTMGNADQLLEAPVPNFTSARDSNPGNAFSVDQNAASWGSNPFSWSQNGWQGWTMANTHDNWITAQSSTPDGMGGFLSAKQLGFTDYYLGNTFPNLKYENPWLAAARDSGNLTDYHDKLARQLLAYVVWYQQMYGEIPAIMQMGNEQFSGNKSSFTQANVDTYPPGPYLNVGVQEMVDLVKACGARLDANVSSGLITMTPPKFLVGTEETEGFSYELASAILSDPAASPYVGAIGFHEYPYGSEFSSLANLLRDAAGSNDAGTPGAPSSAAISIRNQLRDLAAAHGVNVWLTEVSHGAGAGTNGLAVDGNSFDALRGRAIDIHYNLIYANISAFILQGEYYDTALEVAHAGQAVTLSQLKSQIGPDFAVLGDPYANGGAGQFDITTGGYAVGHYARWVKKGDVRVDAASSDPLVMATAFQSPTQGTIAFILINNDSLPRPATFTLSGSQFSGNLSGEQSTSETYWTSLGSITPTDANDVTIILPALSVTSLSGPITQP